jgi:hypothetical protein
MGFGAFGSKLEPFCTYSMLKAFFVLYSLIDQMPEDRHFCEGVMSRPEHSDYLHRLLSLSLVFSFSFLMLRILVRAGI